MQITIMHTLYMSLILLLCLVVGCSSAASLKGNRVLVLLDSLSFRDLFGGYLRTLESRSFQLKYAQVTDKDWSLFQDGELAYDHLLLWAPKARDAVKVNDLLQFVEAGGNIIAAASSNINDAMRDFAYQFSIEFDDKGTSVIDHFHYDTVLDAPTKKHTVVASSSLLHPAILSEEVIAGPPILFKGVAHKLSGKNQFAVPVLKAMNTAYSYDADEDEMTSVPFITGDEMSLVTAVQARNNARVVFVGGLEVFSDKFLQSPVTLSSGQTHAQSGNLHFVTELTKWVFHEKNVLKVSNWKHHKVNETMQLETYRVKDQIETTLTLSQWTGEKWVPFTTPDLQIEAIMLDPYIRTTLTPSTPTRDNTPYTATLHLPDVYGVFKLQLTYYRHGYSFIDQHQLINIRPFAHNEYPRFLTVAYPYYAAMVSMMVAFWVVCGVWLLNRDKGFGGRGKGEKIKSQ